MQTRVLGAEDWPKIVALGGPIPEQLTPERLAEVQLLGVWQDDQLLAYWLVWQAVHLEPLWVGPAFRGNPAVIRALITGMRQVLQELEVDLAFALIEAENLATHQSMAERLGFRQVPGQTFFLEVDPHGSRRNSHRSRDSGVGVQQIAERGTPQEPPSELSGDPSRWRG